MKSERLAEKNHVFFMNLHNPPLVHSAVFTLNAPPTGSPLWRWQSPLLTILFLSLFWDIPPPLSWFSHPSLFFLSSLPTKGSSWNEKTKRWDFYFCVFFPVSLPTGSSKTLKTLTKNKILTTQKRFFFPPSFFKDMVKWSKQKSSCSQKMEKTEILITIYLLVQKNTLTVVMFLRDPNSCNTYTFFSFLFFEECFRSQTKIESFLRNVFVFKGFF